MRFGIQLYTLRELEEPLSETIERVGETAFEGVEFAGLGDEPPKSVSSAIDRSGLSVAGAHIGVESIADNYDETLETYTEIGCSNFVVPSYERTAFESKADAREAGRRLSSLADELAGDDVTLHYHNHSFEYAELDGEYAFDVFLEAAKGVQFEIDIGLTNRAGVDPLEVIERYGDRISLVHVTDSISGVDGAQHVDLGDGEVDLETCVDLCEDVGVNWLLFEHGLTDDPIASMEGAAETLESIS
ncbi:sugar phosphate isomerase/epimerase family protein [Halomontanus rarus]|uniref:sugar phosphate isomerase/epimerase family protein n=1 Tax=Halomontanus rarus TaxID=3034020 RepID=UPI0023E7F511|nr:sugar phosphate isomerase/epimerase [Halovivax sp. TS33]